MLAPNDFILLRSSDGLEIPIEFAAAECSGLFTGMLEFAGDSIWTEVIPIPNVNQHVLKKAIKWCDHHKNDYLAKTENAYKFARKTDRWDWEYWQVDDEQVDDEMLFEIILAANYLDISGLLDQGCARIANMIKGASSSEIRRTFNIQNDFTPEEEDQIRRENEWAEDR